MGKCNNTHRVIAAELGVSKTCVTNTIKKFTEEGAVTDKPRSGCPRSTSVKCNPKYAKTSPYVPQA